MSLGVADNTDHIRSRGRTAMHRSSCSRPIALAYSQGLLKPDTSVFDFGCGRGADLRFLKAKKIPATGWDPNYRPRAQLRSSDVVNLGYVLNVIEDPQERQDTLKRAFELARKLLIVSVRVERIADLGDEYGDGCVTSRGTFQKIYDQAEFKDYVGTALGRSPYVAGLGILYVFKDEELQQRLVATRAFANRLEYRTDLLDQFREDRSAQRFVKKAQVLGRSPLPHEFAGYEALLERYGSPQRLQRLVLSQIDTAQFEGSREQRKQDILTYLATLRLQGLRSPTLRSLPDPIQIDIKAMWPGLAAALTEAHALLFRIGNPQEIGKACRSAGLGKLLSDDLYIHASLEQELPPLLRLLTTAARTVTGEVDYDILKISTDGRAVSFLRYPMFDEDPHPALARSLRVYLPRASYQIRDFSHSTNPPVLHRKESFVGPGYPGYSEFADLTRAEEAAGLLNRSDIGTRDQWRELLKAAGLEIRGHELVHISNR